MPIVKIPGSGGKKKIVCDKYQDGCSRPDVIPDTGECGNQHKAKDYTEADREELRGFKILSKDDFTRSEQKPEEMPRTPRKIYDEIVSRSN